MSLTATLFEEYSYRFHSCLLFFPDSEGDEQPHLAEDFLVYVLFLFLLDLYGLLS